MPNGATAYLVLRRDDGFGDVFPLAPGQRYTLGRAASNRVVLRDDMCSREHAEVYENGGFWVLRDLGSLNGSRLNGQTVRGERTLQPNDELHLGRSHLVFVTDMAHLPDVEAKITAAASDDSLEIRKRLSKTRFLPSSETERLPVVTGHERDLSRLYQLAVAMGGAISQDDLVKIVLDGLLDAIPAEVGAVLVVADNRELEVLAYRHREANVRAYHKVSQFVSREVLSSKEGILAEDVAHDDHFRNRESLAELQVHSLIAAPIVFEGHCLGVIHLYSTQANFRLEPDHLEFAVAIGRQLGSAMHQLQRHESLSAENKVLRDQLRIESELIGTSQPLKDIEMQVARVAKTNATVMIRGESGVGKELVARALHLNSSRRARPFICLNCAALTETLLESELFGHEKGAFTGATERMPGKFEQADTGTIFLDEIGEMALGTQAKFLRVLEGHPFERVGGHTPIKVNVRVVAATNRELEEAVREGTFRRDLFFRLQVVEIRLPPLRERLDDVPLLAEHFLKRFAREMGRKLKGFTPAALARLQAHSWPGNVRELRNVIERAVAMSTGSHLDAADIHLLNVPLDANSPMPGMGSYQALSLEEVERRHIEATLRHTDWNKSQAAAILRIERSTLDRKIKLYDLKRT